MKHQAKPGVKEKLIEEDSRHAEEVIASTAGHAYPQFNLHDLRHVTDKNSPDYGKEFLDPEPFQPAVAIKRAPSMLELMRDQIRIAKLNELAAIQETEDDADDFDIPDDPADPTTRWENDFEPSLREMKRIRSVLESKITRLEQATPPPGAPPGADPLPRNGVGEDLGAPPGETPLNRPPQADPQKRTFFGR